MVQFVQIVQIVAAPTCFLPRVAGEDEGGGLEPLERYLAPWNVWNHFVLLLPLRDNGAAELVHHARALLVAGRQASSCSFGILDHVSTNTITLIWAS